MRKHSWKSMLALAIALVTFFGALPVSYVNAGNLAEELDTAKVHNSREGIRLPMDEFGGTTDKDDTDKEDPDKDDTDKEDPDKDDTDKEDPDEVTQVYETLTVDSDMTLSKDVSVKKSLTVKGSCTLNLNGYRLEVGGDAEISGNIDLNGGTLAAAGNVTIGAGSTLTVDLAGGEFKVTGNVLHTTGKIVFNKGKMLVEGEYRAAKEGGTCNSSLVMTHRNDLMDVNGDFILNGFGTKHALSAGTLQLAGEVIRISDSGFQCTDSHLTILDGSGKQSVTFTKGNQGFNTLQLTKLTKNYQFEPQTCWKELIEVKFYNIAFDGNKSDSGSMKKMKECLYGSAYTLKANAFKRTGYTFKGWNTKADGTGTAYKDKASIKNLTSKSGKTVTLYAQWKPVKYTLTYHLNKGENNTGNPSGYTIETKKIKLEAPTRRGYTFKGWYSDSKFKKRVTAISKGSTGNKELYARWSAKKYTITYHLNGGKNNSANPNSYKITTKDMKLKTPTRKGYKFKGWYSDSKFKKRVTTISKGSTGNKNLYAKWVKK